MNEAPLPCPVVMPDRRGSPVILSVPHSGRDVSPSLARAAVGGARALHGLADPYVDRLVARLIEDGFGAVVAMAPRAAIDVNRGPGELDPDVHADVPPPPEGSKADLGLGLVIGQASRGGPLWRAQLDPATLERRLDRAWRPYHAALERLMDEAVERHAIAVLVDCHSMPPRPRGLPRLVLGDRQGNTAEPWVAAVAAGAAEELGERAAHNVPYAGGEIVRRHGRPARGRHALQVEIDRSLYLDPALRAPGPGMKRGAALFGAIVERLERAARNERARAAE